MFYCLSIILYTKTSLGTQLCLKTKFSLKNQTNQLWIFKPNIIEVLPKSSITILNKTVKRVHLWSNIQTNKHYYFKQIKCNVRLKTFNFLIFKMFEKPIITSIKINIFQTFLKQTFLRQNKIFPLKLLKTKL